MSPVSSNPLSFARARRLSVRAAGALAAATAGVLAAAPLAAHAATTRAATTSTHYSFTRITDPTDTTFNQALGITNKGDIAGYHGSGVLPAHPNKGFTVPFPYHSTNFKPENFPGSVQTQVIAIDQLKNTAGFWVNGKNTNFGFVEWNGVFASAQDPHTPHVAGSVNQLLGLNDGGIAVGFYNDAAGNSHPYSYNQATRKFTAINIPGAQSAQATGINNEGVTVGFATQNGTTSGWLVKNGHLAEFNYPGAASTQAFGINGHNEVVGTWTDSAGNTHGFTLSTPLTHAVWQKVTLPGGADDTFVNGVNDNGALVGFVMPSATRSFAYKATP